VLLSAFARITADCSFPNFLLIDCWHFLCGARYHLRDVIVGKIYFLLVRIKIRHMEIQIIKRESTGSGNETVADGCMLASV